MIQVNQLRVFGLVFALSFMIVSDGFGGVDRSLTDGKAKVHAVSGDVILKKRGNPIEKKLIAGDEISAGDLIQSGKDSTVSIEFDEGLQNAVRIPSGSRVVFESIEPTVMRLEDGTVFNVVNSLEKGATWKVATPAAVAAVRGTVFVVSYDASRGDFFAATIAVPDDGKKSAVEITMLERSERIMVSEGKSFHLKKAKRYKRFAPKDLDPNEVRDVISFYRQYLKRLTESKEEKQVVGEPIPKFVETVCFGDEKDCRPQNCKMTADGKVCE